MSPNIGNESDFFFLSFLLEIFLILPSSRKIKFSYQKEKEEFELSKIPSFQKLQ